ncbi:hypothetical protein D3C81_1744520 [compost metagenome]
MAKAKAYSPTRLPALAREIEKAVEIDGRMPTMMNSATPIAKAVIAKVRMPGCSPVLDLLMFSTPDSRSQDEKVPSPEFWFLCGRGRRPGWRL